MEFDWRWWISVVEIPIIGGLIAWVASTRSMVSDHRIHVAEAYVSHKALKDMEERITAQLTRIEGRINNTNTPAKK